MPLPSEPAQPFHFCLKRLLYFGFVHLNAVKMEKKKKTAAGCGVLGSAEVPFGKRRSVSGSCLNKAGLNPSVHWS